MADRYTWKEGDLSFDIPPSPKRPVAAPDPAKNPVGTPGNRPVDRGSRAAMEAGREWPLYLAGGLAFYALTMLVVWVFI